MTTRRMILTTGAASIVIVGAGLAGARLLHSDLRVARAPWRDAGFAQSDPRLNALSYAILAPNPHNRQPWLARLENEDAITLFCDLTRLLPETDPPNRQIVIGLGAFLELLRQAAAEQGFVAEIDPFPEGEPEPTLDERPVARIVFRRDEAISKDPLFAHIADRRTVRIPFDTRKPVEESALSNLRASTSASAAEFGWTTSPQSVDTLKSICLRGWEIEAKTERTYGESVELMRIGEKQINENPDGVSLDGPVMEAGRLAGVLTKEKLGDPNSTAFAESLRFYNGLIESAVAFGWLVTEDNSRTTQLSTGAAWVRLQLAATRDGISMHPLSQAVQEFPEMANEFARLHEHLSIANPGRVQGLFRFGYARATPPSPRWPLKTRLIEA